MVQELGTDPVKWQEAALAARTALEKRLLLWDGIVSEIGSPVTI